MNAETNYTRTDEKIRAISTLTLMIVIITAKVNPIDKSTDLTFFSLREQLQSLIGVLYTYAKYNIFYLA